MEYQQLSFFARAQEPFWQKCLKQSVRLYLGLTDPTLDTLQVEAGLLMIELEMSWYLVGDTAADAATRQEARAIMEAAQSEWLSSPLDCAALLRERPLATYRREPSRVARPVELTTGCGNRQHLLEPAQAEYASAA